MSTKQGSGPNEIGPDGSPVTVTMTRSHLRDSDAMPAIEFEIETLQEDIHWQEGHEYVVFLEDIESPHRYRPVAGIETVVPIDKSGGVVANLPDWLGDTLEVSSS